MLLDAKHCAVAEIRFKIRGVPFQRLNKASLGGLRIACLHQGLGIVGLDAGQLRIQLYGSLQGVSGSGVVSRLVLRGSHQIKRFRFAAALHHALDIHLPFGGFVVSQMGHSQEVVCGEIDRFFFHEGAHHLDHLFILTKPEEAVGIEQENLLVVGLRSAKRFEQPSGVWDLLLLVVGDCKIHFYRQAGGVKRESLLILGDGFIETAQIRQGDRKV
ncbi:MAG: hypothetical protein U5J83_08395 [Bryobacterales bacterium]|nr:hypothetical protein [Bryobacterales bacterium]